MAHPAYWPGRVYLYAIGNTPAVCFTQDLPPEVPANLLSLGCGDARNILYTAYADLGAPTRKFGFTCCDYEPAILARNVLLFTHIADLQKDDAQKSIQKIWNFYYHFFIDQETFDLVIDQSQKLVDLSEDITTWNDSHYGKFLRLCTSHTLSELRRHWSLYVSTKNLTRAEEESLRDHFRTNNRWDEDRSGINLTSVRAAGPLWMDLMSHGAEHFAHYWKTGVTFNDPAEVAKTSLTNPTFAYSSMGRGFALHYGSDPILSFHIARALAPIQGATTIATSVSGLVEAAVSEFRSWCLSFNERLSAHPSSLVIRFFVADALAACKALHYCAENDSTETGLYTKQWTSTIINLDGGDYGKNCDQWAPLQFDVIDTSNLTDHLGLVNVLVTTTPLLRRAPTSVIYTNTLLPANEEGMARDGFLQRLFGDISILSMIFDLIPVSYVSNFTTHSNTHELISLAASASMPRQFYENIAWRVGSMANSEFLASAAHAEQHLNFDPKQLAEFLFRVYLRMFSDEDMSNLVNLSVIGISQVALVHYLRASYAYLLRTVKTQITTDWQHMMGYLYGRIVNDQSLLVDRNNIQELLRDLHIYGLRSLDTLLLSNNNTLASTNGPLEGWSNVPPLVCVVFKIPRDKLGALNNLNRQQIPTPILMCNIMDASYCNFFQDYQSFFGDLNVTYSFNPCCREPSITFKEDPRGIYRSSSAIFTFNIPTWILDDDLSQTTVTLSFRPNPVVVATLGPTLGPDLTIFSADILDRKYVHFTRERPGNTGELDKLRSVSRKSASSSPVLSDAIKVTLDDGCTKTKILTGRANIVDKDAKVVLGQKARVDVEQVSPQAMKVLFGSHCQIIPFLFPINSTNNKIRIARKSSYVEVGAVFVGESQVDVRLSGPLEKLGMLSRPFPLIKQNNAFSLWNIHYLNLDSLPLLDLSNKSKLEFISPHLTLTYSDREQRFGTAEHKGQLRSEDLDVIIRVKQIIYHLFANGTNSNHRVFALADPGNGGGYTLFS
ncbi:hypothetical protein AMATHDRAFT_47924 [Amanita thiersii Skay4041]|uniref:DUF4470 domain-containing protein n=1 Tax=Amanita thiersii Skay4041 TaxID=703135 RepID=A0A2A9NRU6_9AGAR|nr:hypothetical protein AMATHDRAFT_47924 [Amanita thiersii Skay4041]